ncbi:ABC transporter substrate-binding protein [Halalkalibacter okhensis]|uniref:ABC transporter substrate-binding protein n=1 Tax=Halalkalibacter okhensis TaxID=333138 RepID=A0A0B0IIU0_9BACI|nr:ABC transporter substrate-binding protein [Halalkalibacter okhensis]KHF39959.1 hypothetical protein LQ50_11740 [Halalkalibacter okhensis]
MKLHKQYFTLYSTFGHTNSNTQVYISEIAATLSCSERHAKSLIKQMQGHEWVDWKASSGRGNASTLTFLIKPQDIQQQQVQTWMQEGEINRVIKWIDHQPELDTSFVKWLVDQSHWDRKDNMDILRYPQYHKINSLVPINMSSKHEKHLGEHIYNRVLHYHYAKREFVPELAYHWEQLEHGRIWRIYLRKGILFHNGSSVTSQTIKENIEFWKETEIDLWMKEMIENITFIEATSATVITIHLQQPNKLFLHLFTDFKAMIIPVHLYKNDPKAFQMTPIGSGAYQVTNHTKGHLVLEAYSHYFGYRPFLDKVELFDIPKSPIPLGNQEHYKMIDLEATAISKYDLILPELGGVYIVLNHQKAGVHRHTDFRKMLSYAIERAKCFSNHPHQSVTFPDSLFEDDAEKLRQKSNLDEAKEWFLEQGLTGHTLTLTSTRFDQHTYFDFELDQLKKVFMELGITLKTKTVDVHQLVEPHQLHNTDLILTGIQLDEDRLVSMYNVLSNETSFILNTLPSEVRGYVQSMLAHVTQSLDTETAYTNLRKIESFLLDNNYLIFLYQRQIHIHIEASENLKGIELNHYNRLNYHKLSYQL